MVVAVDCKCCGLSFTIEATQAENPLCETCKILTGDDVNKVLAELRKRKYPGQEHVLHAIHLVNQKIESLINVKETMRAGTSSRLTTDKAN